MAPSEKCTHADNAETAEGHIKKGLKPMGLVSHCAPQNMQFSGQARVSVQILRHLHSEEVDAHGVFLLEHGFRCCPLS